MGRLSRSEKTANFRSYQCPGCGEWIPCGRGRQKLDNHIAKVHPEVAEKQRRYREDLLNGVV